jgi:hypothetical protein
MFNATHARRGAVLVAAERLRSRESVAAEAAALENDEQDRAEMLLVAELMESLREPG